MKILSALFVLTAPLLLSGCFVFYGGGWFWSEFDSTQRVNVGVNGTCTQSGEDVLLDLEMTFHDRGFPREDVYNQKRSMKRHMVIMARNTEPTLFADWDCDNPGYPSGDAIAGQQSFSYCPQGVQPGDEACGDGTVTVGDFDTNGPDKGDYLTLSLTGGFYDEYEFFGILQGGNFTVQHNIE